MATMALAACDPAEFDPDPDVRRDARANRKCVVSVKEQTGDAASRLNTTLPIVEINQYIIDAPTLQERWMCRTDDEGNPTQLYKLGG
ncbi:hypothetical protein OS189_04180 [Sulfitobacter sp. F26169L]|uniref:hypothetical protein n=1 Tax=Sulfitobacter sp. F26169L TaxID=2996015 RepID=UPI0022609013|nr:hypothetical protein [Sulfitobacter sp. F26169L]MCX7565539.1 hypothetical protein [Sulfitobacter sp. F26169L]